MNMVKNNLNLSKKDQSPELAEVFQNKTRPAISLSVDNTPVQDESKEKKAEEEDGQEFAEVFQNFTMQNHLIDLAVAGKKGQVDGKEKQTKLPGDVDDTTESKESVEPSTSKDIQKPKGGKITGWLRASIGLATQIVKEAQPSLNASAVPKDTEKTPDSREESATQKSLKGAEGSLRKVDSAIQTDTKAIEAIDEPDVLDGRVPDEKVEEQNVEENIEAVQNLEEQLDVKEKVNAVDSSEPRTESLTLGAQAAADSISQGAEKASNAVSTGTKTFGAKVRDLNKDGKLANVVTTAAILGAGIGAAVLGSKGGTETVEEEGF